MQSLFLTNPLDMHLHLRQGTLLEAVLPYSAKPFSLALVMPNLTPPLVETDSVLAYKNEVVSLANAITSGVEHFLPLMSIYVNEKLTKQELLAAAKAGVKILKLYPRGATTNSQDGLSEVLNPSFLGLLEEAQRLGFTLCVHGESGGFSPDREREFLVVIEELARSFPRLKIIIEHISDRHSLEAIQRFENLFGTLTLHHVLLTLDDLIGDRLNHFVFCKPVVKTPKDRDALLEAMLGANPKLSFGSDSAPHSVDSKLKGAAGIFTAPILLEALATIFDRHNKLENLQAFVSDNAMKIYDLNLPFKKVVGLDREIRSRPMRVDSKAGDLVVFNPGFDLLYTITSIEIYEGDLDVQKPHSKLSRDEIYGLESKSR